jgi:hypothetical protein
MLLPRAKDALAIAYSGGSPERTRSAVVPPAERSITEFLNVDLDLRSQSGLGALLEALEPAVIVLNETANSASVELIGEFTSLEDTVVHFISIIKEFSPAVNKIWNQCDFRTMNIGIQAGLGPHEAHFTLSSQAISLLASVHCEITFTVYAPPEPM